MKIVVADEFKLGAEALQMFEELSGYPFNDNVPRNDLNLVKVVETLGEDFAGAPDCFINTVEIPDDVIHWEVEMGDTEEQVRYLGSDHKFHVVHYPPAPPMTREKYNKLVDVVKVIDSITWESRRKYYEEV